MPSTGSVLAGARDSPPTGSWHSPVGSWADSLSASSTVRISSPLAEVPDPMDALRLAPPITGPDVVDSVWFDNSTCSPGSDEGDRQSPSHATGVEGLSYFSDKVNLGFPRLSSLSLHGSSPPVEGRISPSQPLSPSAQPDSPPKVRSNIALPPRSGYTLSDDSDSLRSDGDGSAGSGTNSTDSGSDTDADPEVPDYDDEEITGDGAPREDRVRKWHLERAAIQKLSSKETGDSAGKISSSTLDEDTSNDADAEDDDVRKIDTGDVSFLPADEPDEDALSGSMSDELPDAEELEDDLSSLERIFLFAKSDMAYHRVLVSRCLADWIRDVDLTEAVEYVIPLLNGLATDELEVSMVFAPELGRLMWFFFRNCPLDGPDDEHTAPESEVGSAVEYMPRPRLAVSTFTSLLCTLLLNPNNVVSGATQASIVEYFLRSKHYDDVVDASDADSTVVDEVRTADLVTTGTVREKSVPLEPYNFGRAQRHAVLNELFENVAIAISHVENDEQRGDNENLPSFDEESALGRMMSVNLLAAITVEGGFSRQELASRVVPEITNWPLDPAFFVRKEVAAAIGMLGTALATPMEDSFDLGSSDAPSRLFSAANRVLHDHVWQVRQAACYSLPGVFATQPPSPERRENLVIMMRSLHQDVSPNVQLAAFEMIGEIIYLFHDDEEGVSDELVRLFCGQPLDGELREPTALLANPDRSLIVAFNFPAVVLTMGSTQWPRLRPLYVKLTEHLNENVRNSLAASLHELARLLGRDTATVDLVPVAQRFLRDSCPDIVATLLENMDQFWLMLAPDVAREQLRQLPNLWLSQFAHDWHLRQSLAHHIAALAPSLLLADEDGSLVTLLLLALNDPIHALREIGVETVPVVYQTFLAHDEAIATGFLGMLCDLSEAAAYRQRITFLHIVRALVGNGLPRSSFESQLLTPLQRLATDHVLDVRIAMARCMRAIAASGWYEHRRPAIVDEIFATLAQGPAVIRELVTDLVMTETTPLALQQDTRQLKLGPARSMLDSTTIPWRAHVDAEGST